MFLLTFRRVAIQLLVAMGICSCLAAQTDARAAVVPPAVVLRFAKSVGTEPSSEVFYQRAKETLWQVYPEGDDLKRSLVEFVKRGEEGPALGFAGIALIPFHDPSTVRPMLERAMNSHTSPATRWCFLNAAPYILGVGDAMYMSDGKLDKESKQIAEGLMKFADQASQSSVGHVHARELRELLDEPASAQKEEDYGLAVWHSSAYLLGTLELKDEPLLSKALSSNYRTVFGNTIQALGFAANHDFLADLKKRQMNEVTPAMEQAVARAATAWWQNYLRAHPEGGWTDAVVDEFHRAGYTIEQDLRSAQSQRELLRALDNENSIIRYNAYRILNQAYGTHFDLDIAFFAGKYALSFLDPSAHESENESRLKRYWQERLKSQSTIGSSVPAALPTDGARAPSSSAIPSSPTQQPMSLGEAARRLRENKRQKDQQ